MFFTNYANKELAETLRQNRSALNEYNRIVNDLYDSQSMWIHESGPYPDAPETEKRVINFNTLVEWASQDWKTLDHFLKKGNWLIVFISRGGMILLDEIENKIEDYMWTYMKPKTEPRVHEDDDVYDDYTDSTLEDKLVEFKNDTVSILFVEDIVRTSESIDYVNEKIAELADDLEVNIGNIAVITLLTRIPTIGPIPIFGTLISWNGPIFTDWGNDIEDRLDYRDFSEIKEYVDDH
ncbi:MAG: hypothetical protein ACXADA_15475 [Candidatus Hodarchaeales archaeon]